MHFELDDYYDTVSLRSNAIDTTFNDMNQSDVPQRN